jgi:hypothetical protein
MSSRIKLVVDLVKFVVHFLRIDFDFIRHVVKFVVHFLRIVFDFKTITTTLAMSAFEFVSILTFQQIKGMVLVAVVLS